MAQDTRESPDNRAVGYDGIGMTLAAARQRMGLERRVVADQLRIRVNFIEAIERGRWDLLPGRTYAQGFLKTYADFLGIDAEAVLEAYRQESSDPLGRSPYQFRMPRAEHRTPRLLLVLLMMILAVLLYGGWYWAQHNISGEFLSVAPVPQRLADLVPAPPPPAPAPAPSAAPPSASAVPSTDTDAPPQPSPSAPSTPASTPVESPAAAPSSAVLPSTAPPAAPVAEPPVDARIVLRAKGDSWIQVYAAGDELVLSRILRAGETYAVPDRPGLRLTTGSAGALDILVDGTAVPSLGGAGQVKRNIALDPDKLKAGTAVPPPPPPPAPPRPAAPAPAPSAAPASPPSAAPTATPPAN